MQVFTSLKNSKLKSQKETPQFLYLWVSNSQYPHFTQVSISYRKFYCSKLIKLRFFYLRFDPLQVIVNYSLKLTHSVYLIDKLMGDRGMTRKLYD